jgi:hypothetical protein
MVDAPGQRANILLNISVEKNHGFFFDNKFKKFQVQYGGCAGKDFK